MNLKYSKLSASLLAIITVGLATGFKSTIPGKGFNSNSLILQTHIEENLIVPVTIDNKAYSFLVDTGASFTVIDSNIANKITESIELSSLSDHYQQNFESLTIVSGKLDNSKVTFLKPVPITVGVKTIRDHEIWLSLDMGLTSQAVGVDIDGILGIDTFRQMNWVVDNSTQHLMVMSSALPSTQFDQCIGYSDSYNRSPILNLDYENGDVSIHVDTGASDGYFGQGFIDYLLENSQSVSKIPNTSLSIDANGLNHTDEYVLSGMEFNGMPMGDIQISGNKSEQYALGMDFFSRFNQYAFFPSKMMFCYNADAIEQEWETPHRTIYIRYINDSLEVFYNPEQRIAEYGLQNGDIILEANGNAYKPSEIGKLNDILSYTPKGELSITVQRGNDVKILSL